MTPRILRRGNEYLERVQTLLRFAKTMADAAIADQLKSLAQDYQRGAEKASLVDAAKALAQSAAGSVVAHTHLSPIPRQSRLRVLQLVSDRTGPGRFAPAATPGNCGRVGSSESRGGSARWVGRSP